MAKYEDLVKANEAIKTTNIKGKEYAEVNQRIKAFRMLYPMGCIKTELVSNENGICVFKAEVFSGLSAEDEEDGYEDNLLGTGHAYEKESSSYINKTSYIENCETSAVGRALGMAGFGIDTSVCSAEELTNAINNQKSPQWEETRDRLKDLADMKGVPIEEVLKIAKVDALEKLDISRLEGAITWLSAQ